MNSHRELELCFQDQVIRYCKEPFTDGDDYTPLLILISYPQVCFEVPNKDKPFYYPAYKSYKFT